VLTRSKEKLTGEVLQVRSGRLRRSINMRMEGTGGDQVSGTVGTNVLYAAIHEFGGTIPGHPLEAVNAKALRFMPKGASDFIFRRRVQIPDIRMPERSFLRSALREMLPGIRQDVGASLHTSLDEVRR